MENAKRPKKDDSGPSDEAVAEAIEKLRDVQEELEKVNEEASDEILKVEQKYNTVRRPVFEKRGKIIQSIPDFWPTVFMSHPLLFSILADDDHEAIEFLRAIDVEDFPDVKSGHTVTFTFAGNPFFENSSLQKVFKFTENGTVHITGTKIHWKPGKDLTEKAEKKAQQGKKRALEETESFFKWFDVEGSEEPAEAVQDDIVEVIREDVWANPLKYYTQEGIEEDEDGEEGEGEEGDEEAFDEEGEEGEEEEDLEGEEGE